MASGKVQTVQGLIEPSALGKTLTHEHLNLEYVVNKYQPAAEFAHCCQMPITLQNLGWIKRNPYSHNSNRTLKDARGPVLKDLTSFKKSGGQSIVEVTCQGISRDLPDLVRMAEECGVNIIAGAGFYVGSSHPSDMSERTIEQLTTTMVEEVTVGADDTNIKCGVIGEIGCTWPFLPNEKKVLQASAIAQSQLGCPLIIHPGRNPKSPFEIVRILQEAGARIDKTVMSHLDRTIHDLGTLVEFANLGCYCEYDLFGIEDSHYQHDAMIDMPSDAQRIRRIRHLIENGFEDKVVIGHDIHTKHRLTEFGGHGYSHILDNIAPKMLLRGISQRQVDKILVDNPREWLTFL